MRFFIHASSDVYIKVIFANPSKRQRASGKCLHQGSEDFIHFQGSNRQPLEIARPCALITQTHNVLIWSPSIHELETNDIAESWDITSDSLAAWLANKLSAKQLTLVKSASINQNLSLQELSQVGIIDKSFCEFVAESEFKIDIVNQEDFKVKFR